MDGKEKSKCTFRNASDVGGCTLDILLKRRWMDDHEELMNVIQINLPKDEGVRRTGVEFGKCFVRIVSTAEEHCSSIKGPAIGALVSSSQVMAG
jgi:hypothetical protein